ncbi:MAG: dephospho-CoA kinase [Deltaproteobacteria bacterium]|nr:dephospho-CoA kinase [Deltaproteobacteria bacterium]
MIKIGLTGSIGSGKTTVLNLLKDYGFLILNLDSEAKKLLKKNTIEYKKIVAFFGKNILNKDGEINKKILAEAIFSDPSKKKALENIIYPTLRTNINSILEGSKKPLAIIEGAVIIESGYYLKLDKTVLVVCDLSRRIKRSYKKFSFDDFRRRDKNQLNQAEKIKKSDFIINNNYGLKFLIPQIQLLMNFLKNIYSA